MHKRYQDSFIRKIIVVILFMVGFTTADVLGQPGMNAKLAPSDDQSAKKVDEFLAQWDKNDIPGCAVGAVKDGRIVYKRASEWQISIMTFQTQLRPFLI
jgi:CubicO group peptidase (beta-lactamase class C family)